MSDFAQLHRDVAFGCSGGRIIWQPRIGCWFSDKQAAGVPLPEPYEGMDLPAIYRSLGCSSRLYCPFNFCFEQIEDPRVNVVQKELNATDTQTVISTPVGNQKVLMRKSSDGTGSFHVRREVTTEDELKVATWREEHSSWRWDQEKFETYVREYGDLGAPTVFIPRMSIQSLYIEKMGTEQAIYALYDWPDSVAAYFRAREENHDRLIEVINPSPIEIINFGENVHAGTLPPDLFLKHQLPVCRRRCEKLHAAGKFLSSHWDGDCKPLLPFARETGLDAIEAITPEPQGDVTLDEVKEALGDDLFLIDGIPAIYFDETFPVETLIECTYRLIELFAPKLILGISDEISSNGDIERVRVVGNIVDEYNGQFE